MRGNAEAHQLVAPGDLRSVLELMAAAPGHWTPIAGGTELMVAHAAGRLAAPNLVSLWNLRELRFIEARPHSVCIGAGATFQDLRRDPVIAVDFPLLAKAASWIGAIANQSRATLGGNLVNGSPAADSSPALLVYDAEIQMVSLRGKRMVPYSDFHTGYKRNVLAPDELMLAIHLPRRFTQHRQYLRKVGTRRAMAIAKVALGATALMEGDTISEIRLAAASLAPFPARLYRTEEVMRGRSITSEAIRSARTALLEEIVPIDDIRSTAEYRGQVAANLLEEFLRSLTPDDGSSIPSLLRQWNQALADSALEAMISCCASRQWATAMVARRPIATFDALASQADEVWSAMEEEDWLEAFSAHPRIGERNAGESTRAAEWSSQEQSSMNLAGDDIRSAMAAANAEYEERYGFSYIVCATGKSAEEMLANLRSRLGNSRSVELREAAEQQRQIMQIRLRKWATS